jgi:hypothetical protein
MPLILGGATLNRRAVCFGFSNRSLGPPLRSERVPVGSGGLKRNSSSFQRSLVSIRSSIVYLKSAKRRKLPATAAYRAPPPDLSTIHHALARRRDDPCVPPWSPKYRICSSRLTGQMIHSFGPYWREGVRWVNLCPPSSSHVPSAKVRIRPTAICLSRLALVRLAE